MCFTLQQTEHITHVTNSFKYRDHVLCGIKMVFKVSVEVDQSPKDMYCTNVVMNREVEGNARNVDGFLDY